MKYIASTTIIGSLFVLFLMVQPASAQMMYGSSQASQAASSTMDAEAQQGQALLQQLQSGSATCASLTEDNYAAIGDYAMGLMMGSSHDAMDQYVEQAHGADFDRAMHIAMGERFSGCNSGASYPQGMYGFGPMMGGGMMGGGWGPGDYSMMGIGLGMFGYSAFGSIVMALVWIFAIVGVVASVMWLVRRTKS